MELRPTLYAPQEYWAATPEYRAAIINGCGPGGWKVRMGLIQDQCFFLSIKAACDIHDWMYFFGKTLADKEEADRVFRNNMIRIIDEAGGWHIIQMLRRKKAQDYYLLVKHFGGPFFWCGKNDDSNLGKVKGEDVL